MNEPFIQVYKTITKYKTIRRDKSYILVTNTPSLWLATERGVKKYRSCHEKRLEAVWMFGFVVEQLGRGDEALTLFCCAWVSAKTVLREEDLGR